MDIIKKTIHLNNIINFSDNKLPAYKDNELRHFDNGDYGNWGTYPVDLRFVDENGNLIPYNSIFSGITLNLNYEALSGLSMTLPFVHGGILEYSESGATSADTITTTRLNNDYILRYKTLEENYYFIKDFIENVKYYGFCYRRGEYRWYELEHCMNTNDPFAFFFTSATTEVAGGFVNTTSQITQVALVDHLPSLSSLNYCTLSDFNTYVENTEPEERTIGDIHVIVDKSGLMANSGFTCWSGDAFVKIVGVAPNIDEFLKRFRPNGKPFDKLFYYFSSQIMNGDINSRNKEVISSIPYVNLPLYLEEECKSLGDMLCDIEEWVPNKKYRLGNRVIYKELGDSIGDTYILTLADNFEYIEIPESVYRALEKNPTTLIDDDIKFELDSDGIPHFYRRVGYYTGSYDNFMRVTSFDSPTVKHWTKASEFNYQSLSGSTHHYSRAVSKVTEMQRMKAPTDEDGIVLPFTPVKGSYYTELKYLLGNSKTTYNSDGYFYCNTLNKISFTTQNKPCEDDFITLENATDTRYVTYTDEAKYKVSDSTFIIILGSNYADGKQHYFKVPMSALLSANSWNGGAILVNTESGVTGNSHAKCSEFIGFDSLKINSGNTDACISLSFDKKGNIIQGAVDVSFSYDATVTSGGTIDYYLNVCRGESAITMADSSHTRSMSTIINNNNVIEFDYTIDRIIDTNGTIDPLSGVHFVEQHPYSIDEFFCNYDGQYCWYEIKNPTAEEISSVTTVRELPRWSDAKFGNIYRYIGNTMAYSATTGELVSAYTPGTYYKRMSKFYYMNIDYNKSMTYRTDSGYSYNGDKLVAVDYHTNQLYNEMQNVVGYRDESALGFSDIDKDIDGRINRNENNTAAFERHNILCEVNTFADLENYKNDYFKL